MKRRRVKITGIGPVTPAGIGKAAFWKGILEPISRIVPYRELGTDFGSFVAARVDDFRISDYLNEPFVLPKGSSRQALFAVAGAILALRDAELSFEELSETSCAVVTGSSLMDFGSIGVSIDAVQKRGARGAHARALYSMGISSVPSAVNLALGITAPTMGISTQCSAGLDAIGHAANLVANGQAEIAICGGSEAPLYKFPMLELRAADLTPATDEMPARLSRPFDLWRTTGVVSEGAAMFVIEPESSRRRGYSWISGYACGSDTPGDLCGGLIYAAKQAMAEARIRTTQIEAISAWGPGHKHVDKGEADAMKRLFGSQFDGIPTVSIKGAIGTSLGSAPAVQVAAAALALAEKILPPTVNWDYPDPACAFNLSNRSRDIFHSNVLVNTHGAGGVNACMVLERC